ncbi:unnamed protein product [Mycena citricolor]|uniref:DUF659 domain-containing protein n=1 Tax=Mycena citricolor TaxID=2018698 RepID=A0AAD2H8Q9_9AGAR|nr:unnamed protein product [Mycena citricolor]
MELDDAGGLSQTGENMSALMTKWISAIGPERFCAIVSDDAAYARKGRELTIKKYPRMLNFADACHNLHNTCEDICKLDCFQEVIADLRGILSYMSMSSYACHWFDKARDELKIGRGLMSLTDHRFGFVYWSLDSVLRNIPAFVSIALTKHFLDEEDTLRFKKSLERLGAVLMPFARAIQCLESQQVTAADVYHYWLAVTAQLHDLFVQDKRAVRARYAKVVEVGVGPNKVHKIQNSIKELIRCIANFRFTQLIENERASNVYLAAFTLDPDTRGVSVLQHPNPLILEPVVINLRNGQPSVTRRSPFISRIGEVLGKLLEIEYGNEYRPGRTIKEAKESMRKINPYLAELTPVQALAALEVQIQRYLDGDEPFDRKKKRSDMVRDWWMPLLAHKDARVLAFLAVKIFSANPTSMPDERAMSTVTWLNSKFRNRQKVGTLSNHLVVRSFHRMGVEKRSKKPVTINWRDIRATAHMKQADDSLDEEPNAGPNSDLTSETMDGIVEAEHPDDPLSWLDDGLPDLRTSAVDYFELQVDFDITHYIHILSDSAPSNSLTLTGTDKEEAVDEDEDLDQMDVDAGDAMPAKGLWSVWATQT